jgi:hypothetical protein
MLDSGATGRGFIDKSFAQKQHYTLYKLRNPRRLNVVDGRPSSAGDITHIVKLTQSINGHTEKIPFYVTKLGKYNTILGKPWLDDHNPCVYWATNSLTFRPEHCRRSCLAKGSLQLYVRGNISPKPIPNTLAGSHTSIPRRLVASAFYLLATKEEVEIFSLSLSTRLIRGWRN